MIHPWLGIAVVLSCFFGLLALLWGWKRFAAPQPESTRKLLHIGMGLITLGFPWLFTETWPVVVLACVSVAVLSAVRWVEPVRRRLGDAVLGVERKTVGDLLYPVAVAILFVVANGDTLLFCVPILVLSLADALAAIIGACYGKTHYTTADGAKSAEGSVAFFAIAFLSVHVPVLLFTDVGRGESLILAAILGLLVMLIEAACWRGLDNLFIPLGTYAFLDMYLGMPAEAMLWRLWVIVALVGFVLAWRRRTSLDDASLIGSALFGYSAAMLGGWPWLIAPAALFAVHHLAFAKQMPGRQHSVLALFCVVGPGLFWLFAHAFSHQSKMFTAYNLTFAAHLAIMCTARIAWQNKPIRTRWPVPLLASLATAAGAALLLAAAPSPASAGPDWRGYGLYFASASACTTVAAVAYYLSIPRLYRPEPRPRTIHAVAGLLSFAASLASLLLAMSIR
ncbi:MAG: hypothetical protein AAF288_04750 [Planctomycetota bacterium]